MPQGTRVFIAMTVPDPLGRKLSQLQAELAPQVRDCRWSSALPFHATLAFLGDVPDPDLNAIYREVASAVASVEPVQIELKGLGAFPSAKKPRVIWVGMTAFNLKPVLDLQGSVVHALARIGRCFDDKPFHPHVTLGRRKHGRSGPGDLTGLIEHYQLWSAGEFTLTEIHVFASVLGPTGSVYEVLACCPLHAKKNEGSA